MLSPHTRVSRAPNALAERVRGATVVLDPDGGRYVRLNGTAGILWEALEAPTSIEELGARLAEDYGIDAARATSDATTFVSALAERELVALDDS
ncbi:MAG: PqqD family protein [Thermoleophilia bacterium]